MKQALATMIFIVCFAQTVHSQTDKGSIKFSGEVSNYSTYCTRTGITDQTGLFYQIPSDKLDNGIGIDLNKQASMDFLGIDSRLGVDWAGYKKGKLEMGARVNVELYAALGKNIHFRLREACFNIGYDFGRGGKLSGMVGQSWHPFAEDKAHVLSISRGAPFNPYSLAPQLKLHYDTPVNGLGVEAAALWQGYYSSTGADGFSTDYIKWGCLPEFYLSASYTWRDFKVKAGADILNIKPRILGLYPYSSVTIHVNDVLSTVSGFLYAEYSRDLLSIKGKTTLAQSGEHLSLLSGYGAKGIDIENGTIVYTPFLNTASWISAEYGKDLRGSLMIGYTQNLGSKDNLISSQYYVYHYQDIDNLIRVARVAPAVQYNYKFLKVGLEYELTGAQYGDSSSITTEKGLPTAGFHWIFAHRFTLLLSCRF